MTPKKSPPKRSNRAGKKEPEKVVVKQAATKTRIRRVPVIPAAAAIPQAMSEEEIARRAYALWESRGKPFGSPEEDWQRAKELLGA